MNLLYHQLTRGHKVSLSKSPGVVKGRQPFKLIPALMACTSERIKAFRFSQSVKKVAGSHFFDTLKVLRPVGIIVRADYDYYIAAFIAILAGPCKFPYHKLLYCGF